MLLGGDHEIGVCLIGVAGGGRQDLRREDVLLVRRRGGDGVFRVGLVGAAVEEGIRCMLFRGVRVREEAVGCVVEVLVGGNVLGACCSF